VSGSYTSPTGTVRVDFESSPNEQRVATDVPEHIIDEDVELVKLDRVTVSIPLSSPVSIQTQSLALRALRIRKPQETQALALASSQSWLPLLRPSIAIG